MLILSVLLMACGNKSETPEQAVTNALNTVKNADKETVQRYFSTDEFFISDSDTDEWIGDEESLELLFSNLNFKVMSSSENKDTATVKTEITNTDMLNILEEYFQQAMALTMENAFAGDGAKSDEEMEAQVDQIFLDLLKREDNEMVTSTVDIKLSKQDNIWIIEADEELLDSIFGGLFSIAKEIEESFGASE